MTEDIPYEIQVHFEAVPDQPKAMKVRLEMFGPADGCMLLVRLAEEFRKNGIPLDPDRELRHDKIYAYLANAEPPTAH